MKTNYPAASRNAEPILHVLRRVLPASGLVLEIASGTGQHAAHFCPALPSITWQPSDLEADSLESIEMWCKESGASNYRQPMVLDVCGEMWPIENADAIYCANMIHISPWESTLGLFKGAAQLLPAGAPMIMYGPYLEDEVATAPSNESFDQSLRSRDSRWGIRRREDVESVAQSAGMHLEERVEMPANNLCLVFRR